MTRPTIEIRDGLIIVAGADGYYTAAQAERLAKTLVKQSKSLRRRFQVWRKRRRARAGAR